MTATPAVTDEQIEALAGFGVATVYEASGIDGTLDPVIRPVYKGATIAGRALPVRTHQADNLPLHLAVEQAQPGDVIVVDGRQVLCGYWGEVLAVAAQAKGVAGLIMDGGVRDIREQEELGFPVFARGVGVTRTGKNFKGLVNVPVEIGGVLVNPGDAVIADADGIMVLPPAAVEATLKASQERIDKEAAFMERLRAGETTVDLYGFKR